MHLIRARHLCEGEMRDYFTNDVLSLDELEKMA